MHIQRLLLADALKDLSPEWPHDPLPAIRSAMRDVGEKIVVLDDDPTGTQTVHDVPVLTDWSVETLVDELSSELPTLYVLTNSRSLTLAKAQSLNREIGRNLVEAARLADRTLVVVSRSDSTLRGHFPGEVDALAGALDQNFDAWTVIPYFLEGGRYTIDDVHYVAEGDWLTPAGETEFARDPAFAYSASDLRQWVEEKTNGRVRAGAVASISIQDMRLGGPDAVSRRLADLPHGSVCVVNAASMRDLEVFARGLMDAEARGQRFLHRTAASFVRARSGQSSHPLVTQADLGLPDSGGALVVVGSHVPRTTSQLTHLLRQPGILGIELGIEDLLSDARRPVEIGRVAGQVDQGLQGGEDVVVYTERQVRAGRDAEESLAVAARISEGIVEVVRAIETRPRYMIAKGGITASDIATQALSVRRTMVPGQILPGVPLWRLGPESRYPGLTYIVFPGNVGGPEALTEIVTGLMSER